VLGYRVRLSAGSQTEYFEVEKRNSQLSDLFRRQLGQPYFQLSQVTLTKVFTYSQKQMLNSHFYRA
jgi:hypothetical protein